MVPRSKPQAQAGSAWQAQGAWRENQRHQASAGDEIVCSAAKKKPQKHGIKSPCGNTRTENNALLAYLKKRGKSRFVTGGAKIYEELSFAQNGNFSWFSGYDLLPVAAQDVISAAEFSLKQCAVPVVVSGLEMLQNAGKEQMIDLLEARLNVAEATMANEISVGLYSDGTGSGSKTITGLAAALKDTPTTGTYGAIDRASYTFWRNQQTDPGAVTASTIQAKMNDLWVKCVRGSDHPDLIIFPDGLFSSYLGSLQTIQRFTSSESANLGFTTVRYMNADVVLDGGIGGNATTDIGYFLNTKYFHWRPHKDRNMVPLSPSRRVSINQDAEVQILAWAGNLTCSGMQFHGHFDCT